MIEPNSAQVRITTSFCLIPVLPVILPHSFLISIFAHTTYTRPKHADSLLLSHAVTQCLIAKLSPKPSKTQKNYHPFLGLPQMP